MQLKRASTSKKNGQSLYNTIKTKKMHLRCDYKHYSSKYNKEDKAYNRV